MTRGVSRPDLVGYTPLRDPEIARVYWPAEFRQTLLVGIAAAVIGDPTTSKDGMLWGLSMHGFLAALWNKRHLVYEPAGSHH